ncbi:beta-propeller fold lactonase family protein [Dactylosporangium sp. NPDC051485]|uniref:lactonase family protein n=1 Tax=Dactylosporangium sp. NPDC051485 TaxID=3154846 RepID=UPI003434438C
MPDPLLALAGVAADGSPALQLRSADGADLLASTPLPATPGYLSWAADAGVLFVACTAGDEGFLDAYRLDGAGFVPVDRAASEPAAVHVAATADATRVVTAHYRSGATCCWTFTGDRLGLDATIAGSGRSVTSRQQSSHAHSALPLADGVLVADFGADAVRRYRFGPAGPHLAASWAAPPGSGPRHLARTGDTGVLVVCELASTVHRLDAGSLTELAAPVSTLPADYRGANQTSDIIVHAGTILVGNRGHNSVAALPPAGGRPHWTPTSGWPRDLSASPGGLLAVANEDTGWLETFRLAPDHTLAPLRRTAALAQAITVGYLTPPARSEQP